MLPIKEDSIESKKTTTRITTNTSYIEELTPSTNNSSTLNKSEESIDKENFNSSSQTPTTQSEDYNQQEITTNDENYPPKLTHLERIIRHANSPEHKQRLIELYELITSPTIPPIIIELNDLTKPLTKKQLQNIEDLKIKYPYMPPRYFELSICKRMPPMYFMIPKEDIYNVDPPKSTIIKRKRMKPCSLGTKKYVNKKEYKCTIEDCKKTYTSAYGLKYHEEKGHIIEPLNTSTKEYIFRCKIDCCKKSYKQKNGLRYHLKKCHNINITEYNSLTQLEESTQNQLHPELSLNEISTQSQEHTSEMEGKENL